MAAVTAYLDAATSSRTDDWSTDPELFARLDREFGPFEMDVCASPENHKCPVYFTTDDDGLQQQWVGRVWMNPPYGRGIDRWMRKAAQAGADGATVVCLVPARVDASWWREATSQASLVRIFPVRLRFGGIDNAAPFPSALIVFGSLSRRHGTTPAKCAECSDWWFPARLPATTCSDRCRQSRKRRVSRDKATRLFSVVG